MATKLTSKKKRGRPRKVQGVHPALGDSIPEIVNIDSDEQEPVSSFRREGTEAETEVNTDDQLADPALFDDMNQERIPKLEKKGREWVRKEDESKKRAAEAKALAEECILIMSDHGISRYNHGDLHLNVESKVKLKGSID